ncbi:helix-turn-helix transcriptional regulator [Massilia sp. PWRC2]|uniref:helix-turn-helix transcriptional regulator n=1 Tax=Massilia sp. PWRC2 TaxID=2804626 RepID=UPI003CF41EAE
MAGAARRQATQERALCTGPRSIPYGGRAQRLEQLAEALGVSQQTAQAYEVGRRRIPVSALPVVAKLLQVQLEELFGESSHAAAASAGRCRSSSAASDALPNCPSKSRNL